MSRKHRNPHAPVLIPVLLVLLTASAACKGPQGDPGPAGPPGPPGSAVDFYVVAGPTTTVAASATHIDTLGCTNPGDAAVSWSRVGDGLNAGFGVSGFWNAEPVVTGTRPTGYTITFVCSTNPTCEIMHTITCADLTP